MKVFLTVYMVDCIEVSEDSLEEVGFEVFQFIKGQHAVS